MDMVGADADRAGLASGIYLKEKSGRYLMVQDDGLGTLLCGKIVIAGGQRRVFCFIAWHQPLGLPFPHCNLAECFDIIRHHTTESLARRLQHPSTDGAGSAR
jgi:hypothetical protein